MSGWNWGGGHLPRHPFARNLKLASWPPALKNSARLLWSLLANVKASLGTGTWGFGAVLQQKTEVKGFSHAVPGCHRRNVFRSFEILKVGAGLCINYACAWDLGRNLGFSFRRAVGEFKWPSLILEHSDIMCLVSSGFIRFIWQGSVGAVAVKWRRPAREGWGWACIPTPPALRVWAWLRRRLSPSAFQRGVWIHWTGFRSDDELTGDQRHQILKKQTTQRHETTARSFFFQLLKKFETLLFPSDCKTPLRWLGCPQEKCIGI